MNLIKAQIIEKADGEFTAIASTEAKDRHGEIVKANGWDLKNYKQNPILLFMHDHTKPIGKATKIWVENTGKSAKLMFKGVLSSATDEARAARQLMNEGILNSFSVGFMPMEMEGNEITKSELHEISLVSVPANAEARLVAQKSLETAGFSDDLIKSFMPEDDTDIRKEIDGLKEEIKSVRDLAETAVKGLKHLASPKPSQEVVNQRLRQSRIVARAADKLLTKDSGANSAKEAKIIKLASEKLIRSNKEDL